MVLHAATTAVAAMGVAVDVAGGVARQGRPDEGADGPLAPRVYRGWEQSGRPSQAGHPGVQGACDTADDPSDPDVANIRLAPVRSGEARQLRECGGWGIDPARPAALARQPALPRGRAGPTRAARALGST